MTVRKLRAELASDPELGIGNVLSTLVARAGDSDDPALTFDTDVDGHPAWQPMTLRDIERRVAARASWLYEHGIRPRDPVAVYVSSAADHVLNYLALARIGAIPALINGRVEADPARRYIAKLAPVGVLTDALHRERLDDETVAGLLDADVADLGSGDPDKAPAQYRHAQDDAAAITHSSGTTGLPKAVIATHASLFASVRHRLALPIPRTINRILSAFPANHTAMVIMVNLALCSGTELMLLSDQGGPAVREGIRRWQPTCVFGFAATWPELVAEDLTGDDLDCVQMWWNTGDCAHEAHIRKLVSVGTRTVVTTKGVEQLKGATFMDGLGSSETGHSMFFITHTADTDRYGRCIGKPHAFVDAVVLDGNGEQAPVGTPGLLGVRSPTLSPGYWNDSVTTYRFRRSGYYLTGDVVYRDEAGRFYHMDRAVDSVDLGNGTVLYTAQSEERILAACPDVLDCTVTAVRDDAGVVQTDVLLMLTADAEKSADRSGQVRAALDEAVAATVRQVSVVSDATVPYGPTGKVRKVLLRERQTARHAQAKEEVTAE